MSSISKKINDDNEAIKQKTKAYNRINRQTIKTVRKIATELRPSVLR